MDKLQDIALKLTQWLIAKYSAANGNSSAARATGVDRFHQDALYSDITGLQNYTFWDDWFTEN